MQLYWVLRTSMPDNKSDHGQLFGYDRSVQKSGSSLTFQCSPWLSFLHLSSRQGGSVLLGAQEETYLTSGQSVLLSQQDVKGRRLSGPVVLMETSSSTGSSQFQLHLRHELEGSFLGQRGESSTRRSGQSHFRSYTLVSGSDGLRQGTREGLVEMCSTFGASQQYFHRHELVLQSQSRSVANGTKHFGHYPLTIQRNGLDRDRDDQELAEVVVQTLSGLSLRTILYNGSGPNQDTSILEGVAGLMRSGLCLLTSQHNGSGTGSYVPPNVQGELYLTSGRSHLLLSGFDLVQQQFVLRGRSRSKCYLSGSFLIGLGRGHVDRNARSRRCTTLFQSSRYRLLGSPHLFNTRERLDTSQGCSGESGMRSGSKLLQYLHSRTKCSLVRLTMWPQLMCRHSTQQLRARTSMRLQILPTSMGPQPSTHWMPV